ncbi:DUF551 domain-containing protein [Klebsiella michiganensis]|uniref:DUF551 domain-containing protein n=1 Tax=Klebsiella michiganensis TaxID=1134687 RepID=UPI001B822055|nr:DUF551 domain-containing protein [Klebsiella michiganensis]MBR7534378.1 DUF551 domain-containing protein [Klebsiella michiganensis]MBR7574559.1 DUF551 domain-containing protein [Klebsiella michiganensis]
MTRKLTIEQAKRLRNDFECWQQDYDPKDDKEQYDMFGRGIAAMDMLIAGMYQEPVVWVMLEDLADKNIVSTPAYPDINDAMEMTHGELEPLYRHAQQPVVRPAPECQHQWKHGGANKLQNQKQCIKCGRVELDAQQPIVPDERAAFNAWNNDVDCPLAGRDAKSAAWMAWQARSELAGNSPVIPEGYVMVPKEPAAEMIAAAMNCDDVDFNSDETFCVNFDNIYAAMVEAAPQPQNAPQNIPENIPGWIPVSERMPGSQEWVIVFAKWANQQVLCWDDVQSRWTDFEDQSYYADMFTHWLPLPAAPQEVNHG